jgi:hypothetical protein
MNEPLRLYLAPESELEWSLLTAGRSYTASASARAKALAAVGMVGITASSSTAASAVMKVGVVNWIAAAALVASAAKPAVRYLGLNPEMVAQLGETSDIGAQTPAVLPAASEQSPSLADSATPAIVTASRTRAEPKSALPAPLSAELSALESARSALSSGDASAALGELAAYSRNFPRGRLSLEAEVLRIDALARNGQRAAARKRAEAFIKRHPDSVLASRLRIYVEK